MPKERCSGELLAALHSALESLQKRVSTVMGQAKELAKARKHARHSTKAHFAALRGLRKMEKEKKP